ncbi:abasic site processing protein HMCES-like [Anopheles cruzii]|uniref:abasic site processing protein HMCES-like n=1 Tax=Anopheles cruzii TaxID=68878 RepID=UPI0022EC8411|nr:abasic site processing protein HMCES-like [Anopheles cruzii]
MCGRMCLSLKAKELKDYCQYQKTRESEVEHPRYHKEFNCGKKYEPSFNVAPTDVTPVLVSAIHFDESADAADQLLVPMMWGMVPRWHNGDYRKHGLSTINCRREGLSSSTLYGPPMEAGKRCVVLCEGIFAWQGKNRSKKRGERPVFYVYMLQDEKVKVEDRATWDLADGHLKLLRMAGLFDEWEDENGNKLYSYTVITLEAKGQFAEINQRSPAILETDEQVSDWLDYNRVPADRALSMLQPCEAIRRHRVSNYVNNPRHKSDQCNKPVPVLQMVATRPIATPENVFMLSWLRKGKQKETS